MMMAQARKRQWGGVAALGACLALTLACSPKTEQDPPTDGEYVLAFQSSSAAIATETLKIFVFDAALPNSDCDTLTALRRTGQPMPSAPTLLVESNSLPICDLLTGGPGTEVKVGYGARTVVVIGVRKGRDLLIGCNTAVLDATSGPIRVFLTTVNITEALPATSCKELSARCAGVCV